MSPATNPFHEGELAAQNSAGVAQEAAATAGAIRDFMPDQHRAFFELQPFLVIAGADQSGARWVSILETAATPAISPDARLLHLPGSFSAEDPLASGVAPGEAVGLLGIELATRRRNRVNGRLIASDGGLALAVTQSFGNCAQYIQQRPLLHSDATARPGPAQTGRRLTVAQTSWIKQSDTFFVSSGMGTEDKTSFDASHRGGAPGFVEVDGPDRLRFPDYAGNNYFNTIGNLLCDPRIGLLFIDFGSGGMLQMTGRAEIVWHGHNSRDPEARREVVVTIDQVVERSGALALRWGERAADRRLKIARMVDEGGAITSFYLEPADGKPLPTFAAGQHLPIALDVPDTPIPVRRTYSLSGPVSDKTLRISVKREARGIASAHLHDRLEPGDEIVASPPAGDFVLPHGQSPLVLASAGVGVTPMLAMLHALVKMASPRKIWFVQGVRDGNSHAFKDEVARLQRSAPDIEVQTYISSPRPTDLPLPSGVVSGRMTASDLRALGAGEEAHYMLCGPSIFISDLGAGLERLGVPAGQIKFESFGPSG